MLGAVNIGRTYSARAMPLPMIIWFVGLVVAASGQDIRLPPSITEGPEDEYTFQFMSNFEIPCVATGNPEPEYYWMKNGEPLDYNQVARGSNGQLIFEWFGKPQEGVYQCFAKNAYGTSMSRNSTLLMAMLGAAAKEKSELIASQGEYLKLECKDTYSVPQSTKTWVKATTIKDNNIINTVPIDISNRVMQNEEGHLYFTNILASDSGTYVCNTYNGMLGETKGGSRTLVNVQPGSAEEARPSLVYSSPSPVIGLRGREVKLQCIFAGNPFPTTRWRRNEPGVPLPSRYRKEDADTSLVIFELEDEDEGRYRCTGVAGGNQEEHILMLKIEAVPEFVFDQDRPNNSNFTVGSKAVFRCKADGIPEPEVTWFINGNKLNPRLPGPRRSVIGNGQELVIEDVCKDCPADGPNVTDLMNVQCLAKNVHGYVFADAYLNVLLPTKLTVRPENTSLDWFGSVELPCGGETDPSTPLTVHWYRDHSAVVYVPGLIEQLPERGLRIDAEEQDDAGQSFAGLYTCIVTNGYSKDEWTVTLTVPAGAPPVRSGSVAALWWVFVLLVLLLLLLLLLICCCLCMQRYRGDSYPVDEKERANGHDPMKELADEGFHDYQRPEGVPIRGSRASLSSTMKLDSDDDNSLFAEIDPGKFNEDGSFIGQYKEKHKSRDSMTHV